MEAESLAIRLPECRVPVRLLVGAVPHQSGIGADQVELLRQRLTDFAMESVARSGQYIQEEQPGAVVAALGRLAAATSYAAR
jgi:hypothetical protein